MKRLFAILCLCLLSIPVYGQEKDVNRTIEPPQEECYPEFPDTCIERLPGIYSSDSNVPFPKNIDPPANQFVLNCPNVLYVEENETSVIDCFVSDVPDVSFKWELLDDTEDFVNYPIITDPTVINPSIIAPDISEHFELQKRFQYQLTAIDNFSGQTTFQYVDVWVNKSYYNDPDITCVPSHLHGDSGRSYQPNRRAELTLQH